MGAGHTGGVEIGQYPLGGLHTGDFAALFDVRHEPTGHFGPAGNVGRHLRGAKRQNAPKNGNGGRSAKGLEKKERFFNVEHGLRLRE